MGRRRFWLTTAFAVLVAAAAVAEAEMQAEMGAVAVPHKECQKYDTYEPPVELSDVSLLASQLVNEVSEAVAEAARQKEPLKTDKDHDNDKKSSIETANLDDNILESDDNLSQPKMMAHPETPAKNCSTTKQPYSTTPRNGTTICLNEKEMKSVCSERSTTAAGPLVNHPTATVSSKTIKSTHATTSGLTTSTSSSLLHPKTTPCASGTKYLAHIFIASSPYTKCHRQGVTTPAQPEEEGDAVNDGEAVRRTNAKSVRRLDDDGVPESIERRLSLLLERAHEQENGT